MKQFYGNPYIPVAIAVLVAVSVLFAGCSSQPVSQPVTPAATVSGGGTSSAALPYGVIISVPATWAREDRLTTGARDYGRTTTTIARYTSPITIPGDATSTNTLNIDIDQNPGGDFEAYFNQATLALQDSYDTASTGIVKSSTLTIDGYKSYEVDFQSPEVKGSYIFISTEKGMYIFAFRGQNKPVPVHTLEAEIQGIIKSIQINP